LGLPEKRCGTDVSNRELTRLPTGVADNRGQPRYPTVAMKLLFASFLLFLGVCESIASAQSTDQVAALLEAKQNKDVVLRNYYANDNLTFDSTGRLVSTGRVGFGPSDGRVYVEKIKLEPDRLILIGERTVPFYDEGSGSFKQMVTNRSVKIEISLSPGQPAADTIVPLLNTVFLQESELDNLKCPADGAEEFRDRLARARELDHGPRPKMPEIKNLQEVTPLCFPFGERAYPVGRGISPADWRRTPGIEAFQHPGTGVIMLIVDTNGNPTSLYVARSVGHDGDERMISALRKLKFKAARFRGAPVPSVFTITLRGLPN